DATTVRVNLAKFPTPDAASYFGSQVRLLAANPISLCFDLGAQKVRLGDLRRRCGVDAVPILTGDHLVLVDESRADYKIDLQSSAPITLPVVGYERLTMHAAPKRVVFISDGWLQLEIVRVSEDSIECVALHDSVAYTGRGVDMQDMYDRWPACNDATVSIVQK